MAALYRIPVTVPSGKVGGNLTGYPLFIDLSDFSATFWSYIQSAYGYDITVTDADGNHLDFDLINIDKENETGGLFVKLNLLAAASNQIYLYFGDADLTTRYSALDTYRAAVWSAFTNVYVIDQRLGWCNRKNGNRPTSFEGYAAGFDITPLFSGAGINGTVGVARDTANSMWITNSVNALYRINDAGAQQTSNTNPCGDIGEGVDRLGAITYYNGYIYAPAWNYASGNTYRIARFNSTTLAYVDKVNIDAEGYVPSCAGVNAEDGYLYVASTLGISSPIRRYNLSTLAYVSSFTPAVSIINISGIGYFRGDVWVTQDNTSGYDYMYRMSKDGASVDINCINLPYVSDAINGVATDGVYLYVNLHNGSTNRIEQLIQVTLHGNSGATIYDNYPSEGNGAQIIFDGVPTSNKWACGFSFTIATTSASRCLWAYGTVSSAAAIDIFWYWTTNGYFNTWDNDNGNLALTTVTPLTNTPYRGMVLWNNTTSRTLYVNKSSVSSGPVLKRPSAPSGFLIGRQDSTSMANRWAGKIDFVWLRDNTDDAIGDNWHNAEYDNLSSPATFYDVGAIESLYYVNYNANGATSGTPPTDANAYANGDTVTVLGNTGTLARTHYLFDGWNTRADGLGTHYDPTDTFLMGSANVTLYAQWAPLFMVTYDANGATGGTVPVDSNEYASGSIVTVLDNPGLLVRPGYIFTGWNTQADGGGTEYLVGSTFNIIANTTLYVEWTPLYNVTYYSNGATSGAAPTDATNYGKNDSATVAANTGNLARTDYVFSGWNTLSSGEGATFIPGNTIVMTSSVSLYARWLPVERINAMIRFMAMPFWHIFDSNGRTLPGALLYTYDAGTTTPADTYTSYTGGTKNTNPVVADAYGRMPEVWLSAKNYKFVLTDGIGATLFDPEHIEGTTIKTLDYISGSGGGGQGFSVVETISALRNLTGYQAGDVVYVQGYYAANDGGQGLFYFNGTSAATDNGGTILRPASNPATGRWIRFVEKSVDVRWFGAGMGHSDDTACQAAIAFASSIGADLLFSNGEYDLTSPLTITTAMKITGENALIVMTVNYANAIFTSNTVNNIEITGLNVYGRLCDFTSCNDVNIHDNNVNGYYTGHLTIVEKTINLQGCERVTVSKNTLKNSNGHVFVTSDDATIDGTFSNNISVMSNTVENTYQSHSTANPTGIYIEYCGDHKVEGNTVKNICVGSGSTSPTRYSYGICIANSNGISLVVGNISENTSNNEYWVGIMVSVASSAEIKNNVSRYTGSRTSVLPIGINVLTTANVNDNGCYGCSIHFVYASSSTVKSSCRNNRVDSAYGSGIVALGVNAANTSFIGIQGNTVTSSGHAGISATFINEALIEGNEIVDANTLNSSDYDKRSGIVLDGAYRSIVKNNTITNTAAGHAKYGIDFVTNGPLTKYIYSDNVFTGMETANYTNGYTAFPAGYLWDIGDETSNSSVTTNDIISEKFRLIDKKTTVTTLTSSSGDSIVTVGISQRYLIMAGDYIGISLTGGSIQWTICTYTVPGDTDLQLRLDDLLTGNVAIGATIYVTRWKNVMSRAINMYIRGTNNSGDVREIRMNGRRILYGGCSGSTSGRGLALTIITASTGALVSNEAYDIYADAANATALAGALNDLQRTQIGILTSQGTFNKNINAGLITASKRLGLFRLAYILTGVDHYYAYSAIFSGAGISTSNTEINRNVHEVLQDENNNCPNAVIGCELYDGSLSGCNLTNVLMSGNPAEAAPVVSVDSAGTTLVANRFQFKRGTDVASATQITLPSDGNIFALTGTTSVQRIDTTGWREGSSIKVAVPTGCSITPAASNSGAYSGIVSSNAGAPTATIDGPCVVSLTLFDFGSNLKWYQEKQYQTA